YKNPLFGKEQPRNYAKSQNCRFVILSNGNLHYFWDLQQGNPHIITRFPTPESIKGYHRFQPNPDRLINDPVERDYIVLTQMQTYVNEVGWKNEAERSRSLSRKTVCVSYANIRNKPSRKAKAVFC
ncbi:MAG TPA: hypothetical protein VLS45_04480, partial [Methylomicrobium sp.]|nr:hypothetical protein [Methylomicrobium sp.]